MATHRPYRVTVVCTGNICRSPMGEFILRERFEEAGLGDRVVVDSAGTHSWEVGNPADPRTLAVLARNGHDDFGGATTWHAGSSGLARRRRPRPGRRRRSPA